MFVIRLQKGKLSIFFSKIMIYLLYLSILSIIRGIWNFSILSSYLINQKVLNFEQG